MRIIGSCNSVDMAEIERLAENPEDIDISNLSRRMKLAFCFVRKVK